MVCMNQDTCKGVKYDSNGCTTITNAKLTFQPTGWATMLTTEMMDSVIDTAWIATCDYLDEDIVHIDGHAVFTNVESVFECQLLCKGHTDCQAFVYVTQKLPNGANPGDCHFKWGSGLHAQYVYPGLLSQYIENC